MLSTCFEIFILQLAFFKSFKNLVMCFLFSLKNIPWGSRKILPGKIPTWKIPPIKFPSGKFSTGKLIVFLHYFFTQHFVHKWGKGGGGNVHANSPNTKNFDMPGTAQCSQWRRNSNNQHKLTVYSDGFPSWDLSLVNIKHC